MALSDTALALVSTALTNAGFVTRRVFTDGDSPAVGKDAAFVSAESVSLSDISANSTRCRTEVTVKARLYCGARNFYGAESFSALCEGALKAIYFGSELLITRAELTGLKKNMQLGRLEQTLTVTAVCTTAKGVSA